MKSDTSCSQLTFFLVRNSLVLVCFFIYVNELKIVKGLEELEYL